MTTANLGTTQPVRLGSGVLRHAFFMKKKRKKIKQVLKPLEEQFGNNFSPVLLENLVKVKFKYTNYKHDPIPKILALDFNYKGLPHQKTYGQREDVLGWNTNYFENKKDAIRTINDIDTFARMLSSNKLEKYKRIKYFFPEQSQYIRRFNRKYIVSLKTKEEKDWFWKKTTFEQLEKDNDRFS